MKIKNVGTFFCPLYLDNTNDVSINSVRYKDPEKLPPTRGCLQEHIIDLQFGMVLLQRDKS